VNLAFLIFVLLCFVVSLALMPLSFATVFGIFIVFAALPFYALFVICNSGRFKRMFDELKQA
jgi:hypothetical protein